MTILKVPTEIDKAELLQMAELSKRLKDGETLFVNRRGVFDAVVVGPKTLLEWLKGTRTEALRKRITVRLKQDSALSLTEQQKELLQAVKENPKSRLIDLANALKQNPGNIHRRLLGLVGAGLVERVEDTTDVRYRAVPKES